MSKIKSLKLSNFKFFREEETISLNGKHLLLFGENGSGKSSVFWGLYTLLEASMKTAAKTDKYFKSLSDSDESLVNIFANEMSCISSKKTHYNSYIELEDDGNIKYSLSILDNSICGDNGAKESRKATDFINYQAIFKFQEFKNSEPSDLYDVFCYSILPYVSFASFLWKGRTLSNANDIWAAYKEGPGTTINMRGHVIQVYKDSQDYKDFLLLEGHFNSECQKLIDFINNAARETMIKLGYNVVFNLEYTKPSHKKKDKKYEWNAFRVSLKITEYNNKHVLIDKPHTFLNEAKMAAVATTIRLAILDYRIGSAASNALKVLVLDDMMISLDMSNRDKLLDLLLTNFSNKYQILFLTHDKSLYNFVDYKIKQHKQDKDWLRKEMYVGECETTKKEFPVMIDSECNPFEKAKKYYAAKDFTTASIYIRQSLERILSSSLPDELKKKADGQFVDLEYLWRMTKERYNFDQTIIALFEQAKRVLLNPSAHYQRISQPIYRRELSEAFRLIDELEKLDLSFDTLLIEKGKRMTFKHPTENYTFEFELKSDMTDKAGMRNDPKCKIYTWQYNGIEFYNLDTKEVDSTYSKSTPRFSRLKSSLFALELAHKIDEDCFLDNTTVEKGILREALM